MLHEKISKVRKEKGLSQLEVAEAMQVSRQAVSRWEVGATAPSTENLLSLNKLYNVSLDYLLNDTDQTEQVHHQENTVQNIENHSICKEIHTDVKGTGRKKTQFIIELVIVVLLVSVGIITLFFSETGSNSVSIDILSTDQPIAENNTHEFDFKYDWETS